MISRRLSTGDVQFTNVYNLKPKQSHGLAFSQIFFLQIQLSVWGQYKSAVYTKCLTDQEGSDLSCHYDQNLLSSDQLHKVL